MGELEHIPIQPKEAPKRGDAKSEKIGEDLPEGDFDIPMDRVGEAAAEDSSGFTQAQQFIQAIRGEEQKQHKKEEELAQLLRTYIQKSEHDELFMTLLSLIDRNVLATILVAALTLRDKTLAQHIIAQLPSRSPASETLDAEQTSRQLTQQFGATPWDARVKPEIDAWLFTLRELCATYPKRLLKDIANENRGADVLFQQLLAQIMLDFFAKQNLHVDVYTIKNFSEAVVQRLIEQMAEQVNNQKLII